MIILMIVYIAAIVVMLLIGALFYICKFFIQALPYLIVIAGIITLIVGIGWAISKLVT